MRKLVVIGACLLFLAGVASAKPMNENSHKGMGRMHSQGKTMGKRHRSPIWEYCTRIKPDSPNCKEAQELREEYRAKMKELRKKLRQEVREYCEENKSPENADICARMKTKKGKGYHTQGQDQEQGQGQGQGRGRGRHGPPK